MKSNISAEISINIHASIDRVWEALTNPEIIKEYLFGTTTRTDWKVGSPILFEGEWQGKTYQDKGTILANEDKQLIQYDYWSSMSGIEDKPENYLIITYRITGKNDHVVLDIKQENIPDEKTKEHSKENWKQVLEGLKEQAEKEELAG